MIRSRIWNVLSYCRHPITNGVHATSWTHEAIHSLFDEFCPGWRIDNDYLRAACEIPSPELEAAHLAAPFGEGERFGRDAVATRWIAIGHQPISPSTGLEALAKRLRGMRPAGLPQSVARVQPCLCCKAFQGHVQDQTRMQFPRSFPRQSFFRFFPK